MAREPFDRIWTEDPIDTDFDQPTNQMWENGWRGGPTQDPPEAFAQNWWQNRADTALQQIERQGAMSWISTIPYKKGAKVLDANGAVWVALKDNTGIDPINDNGVNWGLDYDAGNIKNAFRSSFGDAFNYEVSPTGRIDQWGYATISANGAINTITLPIPFPARISYANAAHLGTGECFVTIDQTTTLSQLRIRAWRRNDTSSTPLGIFWEVRGN